MIPFLVADRPASLRIIKGANINGSVGIMSHANTTAGFQTLFRDYPCGENFCHAIDPAGRTNCPVSFDASQCKVAQSVQQQTIKMCDCGMFTKEGAQLTYSKLFKTYENMGATYGIMLDVFRDKDATIANAQDALAIYKKQEYPFKLVLVAQGTSVEEYLQCYEALLNMGGEHIAVGGLLQRRKNTARFVNVRDEDFMIDVLSSIRERFNPSWLFALGCFHPKRRIVFEELGVWGSDYKGWIFQYRKRERLIQDKWSEIKHFLEESQPSTEHRQVISLFSQKVDVREKKVRTLQKTEYKTSRRNLTVDDREKYLVDLDNELLRLLRQIFYSVHLDGTRSSIEEHAQLIQELLSKTEQQIRFIQVRQLLELIQSTE